MENRSAENPDDLEIACIGSLYVGPWDKKYWSCSRGKDRFPYPVGYHAIRTHARNAYHMEVREGLKGPLFVVTAPDGSSFGGQTPDIAWVNFQKNCTKVRNWNGKRPSNKIDGSELFGLKNPSVQRLLRELVNTVNMTEGKSLVSPFFCNESMNVNQIHPQAFEQYPNLVPFSGNQHRCSGRRSLKKKNSINDVIREGKLQKKCHQNLPRVSKACNFQQTDDLCPHYLESDTEYFKEKCIQSPWNEEIAIDVIPSHQSNSPSDILLPIIKVDSVLPKCRNEDEMISFESCQRKTVTSSLTHGEAEVNCHSIWAAKKARIDLDCSDCVVDKHIVSQEKSNGAVPEPYSSTTGPYKSRHSVKVLLDRFPEAEIAQRNPASSVPKSSCGELLTLANSSDVCISNTCRTFNGEVVISSSEQLNQSPIYMKNELVAINPLSRTSISHLLEVVPKRDSRGVSSRSKHCASQPRNTMAHIAFCSCCVPEDNTSQQVAKDSLPEVGSSGSPGQNLEDVDLNFAGQELAKSMMACLLPQAVPLLKKTYRRRRSRRRFQEANCSLIRDSEDGNAVKDHLNNIMHQGKLATGALAWLPEKTIPEAIEQSNTLLQGNSFCELTSYNMCLDNDSFSGNGSSKDAKSVIPDSFENDPCSDSAKENPCAGFDEFDVVPHNEVKGKSRTSSLLNTTAIEPDKLLKCLSPALKLDALTSDRNEEISVSDSFLTIIEPAKHIPQSEEPNEEYLRIISKHSSHLENLDSLDAACVMPRSSHHFKHEDARPEIVLGKSPNEAEKFVHCSPPYHIINDLTDNQVSQIVIGSHDTFGSTKDECRSSIPIELVTFDMCGNNKGEAISVKGIVKVQNLNGALISSEEHNALVSESVIRRNLNDSNNALDVNSARKSVPTVDNDQPSSINLKQDSRMLIEIDEQENKLGKGSSASESEGNRLIAAAVVFQSQDADTKATEIIEVPNQVDSMYAINQYSSSRMCSVLQVQQEVQQMSEENRNSVDSHLQPSYKNSLMGTLSCSEKNPILQRTTNSSHKDLSHGEFHKRNCLDVSLAKIVSSNEGDKLMELVGCYVFPQPISHIVVATRRNQLQLCVLCGFPEGSNRYLFMYAVSLQEQRIGCPSFLGYTSLLLPHVRNPWNKNIPFERSALQFASDGQLLIFINSIKAPRCREQKISCLCANCKSELSMETTLEIVHVNFGYVSRMAMLMTCERVSCILVFEPNYLIAVEENGELHVWVMNFTWSETLEEFMLPNIDNMSPMLLELKRVPKCDSLIIGHNGLGDFGLWDISKRVLLSRYSSPGSTVFQIIPVSLFNLHTHAALAPPHLAEHLWESMQKSNCKSSSVSSLEGIAIWILISVAPALERVLEVKELGTTPVGLWRLALMTNNMIFMGSILDPRATAVDASAESGIIGTSDGFLYKWELSSGRKLASLTPIQCGVSCVALDAKSGALAAAGRDGRLHVYIEL